MTDCSSLKKCFHSHDAAMRDARRRMVKHRGIMLRVYRCVECKHWHMTSLPEQKSFQTVKYLRNRREVEWP